MSCCITSFNPTRSTHGPKRGRTPARPKSFVIYVSDSNVTKVCDKFFYKHEIHNLRFKSKTWSKAKRLANAANVAEFRKVFGDNVSINYSETAGCPCGCSKGFIVRGAESEPELARYLKCDVHVKVEASEDRITKLTNSIDALDEVLADEIISKGEPIESKNYL